MVLRWQYDMLLCTVASIFTNPINWPQSHQIWQKSGFLGDYLLDFVHVIGTELYKKNSTTFGISVITNPILFIRWLWIQLSLSRISLCLLRVLNLVIFNPLQEYVNLFYNETFRYGLALGICVEDDIIFIDTPISQNLSMSSPDHLTHEVKWNLRIPWQKWVLHLRDPPQCAS